MIERQKSFLVEILGESGANALFKSAERSELLTQALLPRAIFSWVKGIGEFEGFIPGGDELISFTKSEAGFSGKVGEHEFKDASLIHVSAVLAVTMGTDRNFNVIAKSVDLDKLGKSIDLLVRSKLVQEGLEKSEFDHNKHVEEFISTGKTHIPAKHKLESAKKVAHALIDKGHQHKFIWSATSHNKDAGTKAGWQFKRSGEVAKNDELEKDELEKANPEAPVKSAAPVAPTAPVAAGQTPAVKPAAPKAVATAPKMPKIKPPGATVALTQSEMNHVCPMCAGKQFENDEFVGCVCFQTLNKSVETLMADELGTVIHISEPMDVIVTLLESLGRE